MPKTPAITIFAGGEGGYGDAVNVGRNGYHWAYGMDCRTPGRASLVPGPNTISYTAGWRPYGAVDFAMNWAEAGGTPYFLFDMPGRPVTSSRVLRVQDGSINVEAPGVGTALTGGALYRGDGSDADAQRLFACNGSTANALRTRTQAGSWAAGTANTAKADQLYVISQDLWRVTGGYKLEKLIFDSADPTDDDNWGPTKTPVGIPSYDINTVLSLGGSPVVLKGEGVYTYNPAPTVALFENQTPFVPAHPDNGKGGFADGRGRVYYPTVTGRILVITFGSQRQVGPLRFNWVNRDTPWGRISQMTADEEYVYAAIEPGSIKTQQLTMTVMEDSDGGGTWTNHTTNVNNQLYTSTANLNLTGAAGYLYIGADEPFWGVYFQLETAHTGSLTSWTVQYSTGSGGWNTVTHFDSTLAFSEDGCLAIAPGTDIVQDATNTWAPDTVNSVTGKYWIRMLPSAGVSDAKLRAVQICPYRPPLDTAATSGNTSLVGTGQMLAGVLPKVLVGQWRGETLVWHDWLTLRASKVLKMLVSRVPAASTVGETTLYMICGSSIQYVPIGPEADPARAFWPNTNGRTHVIGASGIDFQATATVEELVINGEHLQSDDDLRVYWRWDNEPVWYKRDGFTSFPVVLHDLEGRGRVLYSVYAVDDASRDALAPFISTVQIPEGKWVDEGEAVGAVGEDIASPMKE